MLIRLYLALARPVGDQLFPARSSTESRGGPNRSPIGDRNPSVAGDTIALISQCLFIYVLQRGGDDVALHPFLAQLVAQHGSAARAEKLPLFYPIVGECHIVHQVHLPQALQAVIDGDVVKALGLQVAPNLSLASRAVG